MMLRLAVVLFPLLWMPNAHAHSRLLSSSVEEVSIAHRNNDRASDKAALVDDEADKEAIQVHPQIVEDYDYVEGLDDSDNETELPDRTDDLLPSNMTTDSSLSTSTATQAAVGTESSLQAVSSQTIQSTDQSAVTEATASPPSLPPFPTFPPGFPFQHLPPQTTMYFNITFPNATFTSTPNIAFNTPPVVIVSRPVIPVSPAPVLSMPPYNSFPIPPPIVRPPSPPLPPTIQLCYNYGTAAQYCNVIN